MALGAHMRPYSYMYCAPHRDGVLHVMPITVWNPPAQSVKPHSSRSDELKRKGSETGGDGDSFLLKAELAAGAVSSILKDYDL